MTHVFRELFEAVVLALLIFFLIQGSIENFKVEGSSMKPELSGGEYVMVNKLSFFRVDMRRLSDLSSVLGSRSREEAYSVHWAA